jgi:hypothetical protein
MMLLGVLYEQTTHTERKWEPRRQGRDANASPGMFLFYFIYFTLQTNS